MDINLAKAINEYLQEDWDEDPKIDRSYSGRSMYGRETAAVICNNENIAQGFFNDLGRLQELCEEHEADISEIVHIRRDSMGLGYVYY